MKLTGSVGKMGRNDKGDVALVQQALATIKVKGKFGSQPLWKGRADGRNSRDLEAAIAGFQSLKGLRPTGKLDNFGPGMTKLKQTLPASFRATQASGAPRQVYRNRPTRGAPPGRRLTRSRPPPPSRSRNATLWPRPSWRWPRN